MALKSTIFKIDLNVSDMDRHYYGHHALTLARHPSETDERMMARVLAFALNASDSLCFTRGLCADDEPEIWEKSLTDDIDLWIDIGLPDPRRLRKASHRACVVRVYAFGGRTVDIWWDKQKRELAGIDDLAVFDLNAEATSALADRVSRSMRLGITIEGGQLWVADDHGSLAVPLRTLKQAV